MSLDRCLMLLLRQFHLEHIQGLAEASATLTAGGRDGEREALRSGGRSLEGKEWQAASDRYNESWSDTSENSL